MNSALHKIISEKHKEVERLKSLGASGWSEHRALPVRDFTSAISSAGISLIGEIKFASPSSGIISRSKDPVSMGRIYEKAGAAAVSLLTDKPFFKGDLNNLPVLKRKISLPVLRKDFIIHEIQIRESYLWGADAVLLIVRILPDPLLKSLLASCKDLGMAALTEVHNREDLQRAIDAGAGLIGINNRDLDTFEINLDTTKGLAPMVPRDCTVVSESGIKDGNDIKALTKYGVRAVLVGTSLMKCNNIMEKARELVEAGKPIGQNEIN